MSRTFCFLSAAALMLGLFIALGSDANEPNGPNTPGPGIRPAALQKTPVETRVKLLERRVDELEKLVDILVRDNRRQAADLERIKGKLDLLDEASTSGGQTGNTSRSYRPPRRSTQIAKPRGNQ